MSAKEKLQELIATNRLDQAFKLANELVSGLPDGQEVKDELIGLSASWNALKRKQRQGLLANEQSSLQENQLTHRFLEWVNTHTFPENTEPTYQVSEGELAGGDIKPTNEQKEEVSKHLPPILLFISGLFLFLSGAGAAFLLPCPISDIAYIVIKILMAVGGGFLGGYMTGFLSIQYKGMVQAGGGLAVFFALFALNPTGGITSNNCPEPSSKQTLRLGFYLNDHPTPNIRIGIPSLEVSDVTNRDGNCRVEVYWDDVPNTISFYLKGTGVDTLIKLPKKQLETQKYSHDFYIKGRTEAVKLTEPEQKKSKAVTKTPLPKQKMQSITLRDNPEWVSHIMLGGKRYEVSNETVSLPKAPEGGQLIYIHFKDAKRGPWEKMMRPDTKDYHIITVN